MGWSRQDGRVRDEVVYRLTQSPAIHLLGTALGCALGLLLTALRMPLLAALVVAGSAGYALVRLKGRTVVTVTRRRVIVSGVLGESAIPLSDVRAVRVEKDLWSRNLVVETREGRALRVRDVHDPAGAVAVIQSVARHVRDAEPGPGPARSWAPLPVVDADAAKPVAIPAFLPPGAAAERTAVESRVAHKARVRAFDLHFLDESRP